MKKIYIQPQVKGIVLKPVIMLEGSPVNVNENNTSGEGGWGGPQSTEIDLEASAP